MMIGITPLSDVTRVQLNLIEVNEIESNVTCMIIQVEMNNFYHLFIQYVSSMNREFYLQYYSVSVTTVQVVYYIYIL